MRSTVKPCEQRELPAWATDKGPACREVGARFIRDAEGYGHWVCPGHEHLVRAFFNLRASYGGDAFRTTSERGQS
jgi:hypothetical protein